MADGQIQAKKRQENFISKRFKRSNKLLTEEIPFETQLYEALDKKPSIDQVIHLVYYFIKDFSKQLASDSSVRNNLLNKMQDVLDNVNLNEAQQLQILFIFNELKENKKATIDAIIEKLSNEFDVLHNIKIIALKKMP